MPRFLIPDTIFCGGSGEFFVRSEAAAKTVIPYFSKKGRGHLKKMFFCVGFFCFSLFFLSSALFSSAAGEPIAGSAPTVTELYPGVSSSSYSLASSSAYGTQKITVVEFDPKQEDLYFDVTNTRANLNNLRTVSKAVSEFNQNNNAGKTVIAALNGDMWTTAYAHSRIEGKGTSYGGYSDAVVTKELTVPRGFTMYNGEIVCSQHMVFETPYEGVFQSFGMAADRTPLLGQIDVHISVKNLRSDRTFSPDGLNRLPANDAFVLYSDKGPASNYALSDAFEITVDCDGDYRITADSVFRGKVTGLYAAGGAKPAMQENRLILTFRGTKADLFKEFAVGDEIEFSFSIEDRMGNTEQWKTVTNAVGGHMPLILNGVSTGLADSTRYPAAILGIKENGNVVMIINDGRQSGYSVGLKISLWDELLSEIGVKTAFLLDGGGSAEMVALNGAGYSLVNRPCNKKTDGSYGAERTVVNTVFLSWHQHSGGQANCASGAVCDVCGESYGPLDSDAHSYQEQSVAPTCEEDGGVLHRCVYCDDRYLTDILPALGHTGGTATCLDRAVCARCYKEYGEVDPNGHFLSGTHCSYCGAQATLFRCGDLNYDGRISSVDAVLCSRLLAGWDISVPLFVADMDGDGRWSVVDGVLLKRSLARWTVQSKIGEEKYLFDTVVSAAAFFLRAAS